MSKSFLKSTTVWGGLILGIKAVALRMGFDLDDSAIEAVLSGAIDLAGVGLVIWGRYKAAQPVHFLPKREDDIPY